ncbi:MAG: hypothetical protein ACJ780_28425 [Solirubrobacteraceae bacterium]
MSTRDRGIHADQIKAAPRRRTAAHRPPAVRACGLGAGPGRQRLAPPAAHQPAVPKHSPYERRTAAIRC